MPLNPIDGSTDADLRNGTSRGDHIRGFAGNDTLYGYDRNDLIEGGEDDDSIFGGYGNDRLFGGDGNDRMESEQGNDTMYGGAGDDVMINYNGYLGGDSDSVFGGDGNDFLFWSAAADGFYHGGRGRDMVSVFWVQPGTALTANTLSITDGINTMTLTSVEALTVYAAAGDDWVTGGRFADYLSVAGGANNVDAGAGNDTVIYTTGLGNTLQGGAGDNDRLIVGPGEFTALGFTVTGGTAEDGYNSTITGFERYQLNGGGANDTLTAGDGNDKLYGNKGLDVLNGGGGRDILLGGAGDDALDGGSGNDSLNGGPGIDTMTGGEGEDVFIFVQADGQTDIVTDFETGLDILRINAAAFGSGLPAGVLASLTYDEAVGTDGQFVYDTLSGGLYWDGNGDGDGPGTLVALLDGIPMLVQSDIVLV